LFDPVACFVAKAVKAQMSCIDQTLVNAMIRLQHSLYNEQWDTYMSPKNKAQKEGLPPSTSCLPLESLECYFMFALIWCIGVTVDDDGRGDFNVFIKNFLNSGESYLDDVKSVKTALLLREWTPPVFPDKKEWHRFKNPMPNVGVVFDYCYIGPYTLTQFKEGRPGEWRLWADMIDDTPIPDKAQFSSIVVPTKSTAQLSFVVSHLVSFTPDTPFTPFTPDVQVFNTV
jgi:hypothetical protein